MTISKQISTYNKNKIKHDTFSTNIYFSQIEMYEKNN